MKSIVHNLGLGDHIICAPIVARMASETSDKVVLPCWVHNKQSVESFFVNYPNVFVVPIEKESQLRDFEPGLRLGHYSDIPRNDGEDFISWFYRQADFPLEDREKWCPLARVSHLVEQKRPLYGRYAFVHEDYERGFIINGDRKPLLSREYPHMHEKCPSILCWHNSMFSAAEIHCIDSSFLHLADALPTTGKLFFHRYARSGEHNKNLALRKKWEVIE